MKADLVHSILAASMVKPSLLADWQDTMDVVVQCEGRADEFDVRALRLFAGLGLKVRHNALRGPFANTFRLLCLNGLEMELFADFASHCSLHGLELASQNEERARRLVQFIGSWHQPDIVAHALLWDMARHEQAVSELDAFGAWGGASRPQDEPRVPDLDSRVCRSGAMRFHETCYRPLEILEAMRVSTPDLSRLQAGSHLLAYWRACPSSSVQLVELDAFGFLMLQSADGSQSLRKLATFLGIGRARRAHMLTLAHQLVRAGLLVSDRQQLVEAP